MKFYKVTSLEGHRTLLDDIKCKETSIDDSKVYGRCYRELFLKSQQIQNLNFCSRDLNNFENALWIEKYKPTNYIELLTSETYNRNILLWLKSWDYCVFNREPTTSRKIFKDNTRFEKGWNQDKDEIFELDERGKPLIKVAIIWGPPGLGKTTLAQVLAKHVGYDTVEINASDERNVESFTNLIKDVIQTHSIKSVLNASSSMDVKPKCLIFDEIDGATAAAVNTLVNMLKSDTSKLDALNDSLNDPGDLNKGEEPNMKSAGRLKASYTKKSLNRPIICLANDVYVPALKPLREHAYIVHINAIAQDRLLNRLKIIASREKIITTTCLLNDLCYKLENDIRSCINCLQFMAAQSFEQGDNQNIIDSNPLHNGSNINDIQSKYVQSSWYIKDRTIDMNYLVNAIFNTHLTNSQHTDSSMANQECMTTILKLVSSVSTDLDRLSTTLFERYLLLSTAHSDYNMAKINSSLEWLTTYYDCLSNYISTNQTYTLYRYLPILAVIFSYNFQTKNPLMKTSFKTINNNIIASNKRHFKSIQDRTRIKSTLSDFVKLCRPSVKSYIDRSVAVLDLINPFLHIIKPSQALRQVNFQFFTAAERDLIRDICLIMMEYNVTYKLERRHNTITTALPFNGSGNDGYSNGDVSHPQALHNSYHLILDPDIETITKFNSHITAINGHEKGLDHLIASRGEIPFATKQIIQHQLKTMIMKKTISLTNHNEIRDKKFISTSLLNKPPYKNELSPSIKKTVKLLPTVVNNRKKLNTFSNYFIHPKNDEQSNNVNSKDNNKEMKQTLKLPKHVKFCYNDGHTNAVRRHIKIKDFLSQL